MTAYSEVSFEAVFESNEASVNTGKTLAPLFVRNMSHHPPNKNA